MENICPVIINRENALRLYTKIDAGILEYLGLSQHLPVFNEQPHRLIFRREHSAIHQEHQLLVLLQHIAEVVIGCPFPSFQNIRIWEKWKVWDCVGRLTKAAQMTRIDVYAFLFTLHLYH